jgi:transcriptional regulator with XRE-family HTH domain
MSKSDYGGVELVPYVEGPTPGELLRDARDSHGLTQKQLAIRANTTQSAISRIEAGRVSPSFEMLRTLLRLAGEDLVLTTRPYDSGVDATLNRGNLKFTPDQRVQRGLAWAEQIKEIQRQIAPQRGARSGPPAT